jgi:hypothetical protein
MKPGASEGCEPLDLPRMPLVEGPTNRNRSLRTTFSLGRLALMLAACGSGPGAQILG